MSLLSWAWRLKNRHPTVATTSQPAEATASAEGTTRATVDEDPNTLKRASSSTSSSTYTKASSSSSFPSSPAHSTSADMQSKQDTLLDGAFAAGVLSSSRFLVNIDIQRPPQTPPGLRPRQALAELRKELGLPEHDLQQQQDVSLMSASNRDGQKAPQNTSMQGSLSYLNGESALLNMQTEEHSAADTSLHALSPWRQERSMDVDEGSQDTSFRSDPILAGRMEVLPPLPSSSWSTQGTTASPPVSTARSYISLYAGSSSLSSSRHMGNHGVAASPHLAPGHARTAVGALVALQEQQQQQNASSKDVGGESRALVAVPRTNAYSFSLDSRADCSFGEGNNTHCRSHYDYYALDEDPIPQLQSSLQLHSISPQRPPVHRMAASYNARQQQHDDLTPRSTNSSLAGSPSSRSRPIWKKQQPQKHALDSSFSSQLGLIASTMGGGSHSQMHVKSSQQQSTYDFGPVVENGDRLSDVMLSFPGAIDDDIANLSNMSQSASAPEMAHYSARDDELILLEEDDDDDEYEDLDTLFEEESEHYPQLDGDLLRVKSQNQRRVREDLVLSAVERLQDDLQLVADVEKIDGAETALGDWFVQTPLDQPGLLTGMDPTSRSVIVGHITDLLDEMDHAQPEDFFLSPTQIAQYGEPHNDLRQALSFCKTLVGMAVPKTEKAKVEESRHGQWRFMTELRGALGIIAPESPEQPARGGDTSVFSLPSDSADTPMTSNVSLTTTITTAHSTHRTGFDSQQRDGNAPFVHSNGLQIRRTIEVLSAILQKMSLACFQLRDMGGPQKHPHDAIRITEDIKRHYLQLLAVETIDLKALVNGFQLDFPPFTLSEKPNPTAFLPHPISNDDDEPPPPPARLQPQFCSDMMPLAPPAVLRSTSANSNNTHPHRHGDRASQFVMNAALLAASSTAGPTPPKRPRASYHLPFSPPISEDMRTTTREGRSLADDDDEPNRVDDDERSVHERYDPEEYDDLRRQYGSADYDDEEENRDGPAGGAEHPKISTATARVVQQIGGESWNHGERIGNRFTTTTHRTFWNK